MYLSSGDLDLLVFLLDLENSVGYCSLVRAGYDQIVRVDPDGDL